LRPTPVGMHPLLDQLKYLTAGLSMRTHRLLSEWRRRATQPIAVFPGTAQRR
jgi:hypothetical protein